MDPTNNKEFDPFGLNKPVFDPFGISEEELETVVENEAHLKTNKLFSKAKKNNLPSKEEGKSSLTNKIVEEIDAPTPFNPFLEENETKKPEVGKQEIDDGEVQNAEEEAAIEEAEVNFSKDYTKIRNKLRHIRKKAKRTIKTEKDEQKLEKLNKSLDEIINELKTLQPGKQDKELMKDLRAAGKALQITTKKYEKRVSNDRDMDPAIKQKKAESLTKMLEVCDNAVAIPKITAINIPISALNDYQMRNFLITNHTAEKMISLGHEAKINDEGKPTFLHTSEEKFVWEDFRNELEIQSLYETKKLRNPKKYILYKMVDGSLQKETIKDFSKVDYESFKRNILIRQVIQDLHPAYIENNYSINARELSPDGFVFRDQKIDDLSKDEFLSYFFEADGKRKERHPIKFTQPGSYKTIEELEQAGIVNAIGGTGGHQYLGMGFIKREQLLWENLEPYKFIDDPAKRPKKPVFTIASVVKGEGAPSLFDFKKGGHSYIELTTPEGHVYCVGITVEGDAMTPELREAKLLSPDRYITMSSDAYHTECIDYELKDNKALTKVIRWLEGIQSYHKDDEGIESTGTVIYNTYSENCFSLALDIRDNLIKNEEATRIKTAKKERAKRLRVPFFKRIGEIIGLSMIRFVAKHPWLQRQIVKIRPKTSKIFDAMDKPITVDGYEFTYRDLIKKQGFKIDHPREVLLRKKKRAKR